MDLDGAELVGAAAGGDLDVRRDADTEQARIARVAPLPLLGAQLFVADLGGCPIEREPVPAVVVGVARDRREREHVVGEEVLLADLDRVDAELQRRLVDGPFDEGGRFRSTRAAIGAHRGGVRDRDRDVELDRAEVVGALRHPSCTAGQVRTDRRVATGVADEAHPQTGERPVVHAAELDVLDLAPAVRERLHVVAARRDPHDRTLRHPAGGGDDRVLGVDAGLAAEAATDLRRDDPDIGTVHPERRAS